MAVTKKVKKATKKPIAKGSGKTNQNKKKVKKASKKPLEPAEKTGKGSGKSAKEKRGSGSAKKISQKKAPSKIKIKKEKVEESIVLDAVGMDDVPISASEADRDLMAEVMPEGAVSDEDALDGDAAEAEARVMDLDEVATEADALEDEEHEPADASDLPDAADMEDTLEDYAPLPISDYGDDFDGADVMSGFAGRSILGAEERNAVIQEVKQRAEKNGGYVTYDELNQIVPMTVQDDDKVGTIIEALNAEGYKTVTPVFIETALKVKYARDNESVQVIDMLIANRIFDFGYVYDCWGGCGFWLEGLVQGKKTDFESYYAKNEKKILKNYQKVFDLFESMANA